MATTMVPVVLAGGSGSRLWPLSRTQYPKQFLPLCSDGDSQHSMLQQTLLRLQGLPVAPPLLICNEDHRFIAAEQLRAIDQLGPILLEPAGRNTAPALALAAMQSMPQHDPLLLVLAADHRIAAPQAFREAVTAAMPLAEQGKLVTFGVVPDRPHCGYGYIRQGQAIEGGFHVDAFVEKPNQQEAQRLIDAGDCLWNSGMFLFRASRYLAELKRHRPDIATVCRQAMANTSADLDFIRVDQDSFAQCPSESIDYAVMEHTDDAVVVPLQAGWSDVGAWSALWDCHNKDAAGNSINADVLLHEVSDCLIHSKHRLIAGLGVSDLIIVDTADALLVANRHRSEEVKHLVEQLKGLQRTELDNHRKVYRPWGNYDSIDNGARYQVKRITVKPGARLSVQMHHHRAEHWVVVSGTAKVTNGEHTFLVTENQSTYIPIGTVHSLENPGMVPLELIEVQSGSYLGEDDIIRLEDNYGRAES